jgi:rhamnose utilization protein RhaD (predicted bifunctional aldolase and dehydrogenase)/NAD(P)-dependent dehydrogenase (short-subunit alcohol dehydrogenase family)
MRNRWTDREGRRAARDPLAARVYTSRLLGQDRALALHGGGNTSVKAQVANRFGDAEEILYVKGSGWDLATIEPKGFSPVKLDVARRLATLDALSDPDMVAILRSAMIDPSAPTPSVEAILHALIPFRYVDHTHADAVVAITNSPQGLQRIGALYGRRVLVVPYVMPGFLLAKHVHAMTRRLRWEQLDGIVLAHHGLFTFGDNAKTSYEATIRLVSAAERYLKRHGTVRAHGRPRPHHREPAHDGLIQLARLRRAVSVSSGAPMLAHWDDDPDSRAFASAPDAVSVALRGPLTPDHVIRTKRIPVMLGARVEGDVARYAAAYRAYFARHAPGKRLVSLDPAPRWAVWPSHGRVAFGRTVAEARIVSEITRQTMHAIRWAEALGGWKPLSEREIFDVEYWTLEQAKLKRSSHPPVFQGKVALVTGAASGIGRACVEALRAQGAAVAALDLNHAVRALAQPEVFADVVDVTRGEAVRRAVQEVVRRFGGLDILISNAGVFPASEAIAQMTPAAWHRSLRVNLDSHQLVLQACIPYLSLGMDPAVVVIGSKNVRAPGPGASAYSVAKAGLTQLARVAALELGPAGVRVNVLHPNQVFDTGIWTPRVLAERAKRYGMTTEAYQTNNLLRVRIVSKDVAALACAMAGPLFAKTTGAQVPIDGGNDRVV